MSDKSGFAERLARIEARQGTGEPEMLAGVASHDANCAGPAPKRRIGAALIYLCLGLGLIGAAGAMTLHRIEASTPGTTALIAEKLSNGEKVNFLEIITRANVGEEQWQTDTAPTQDARDSKLSDIGRFIMNN